VRDRLEKANAFFAYQRYMVSPRCRNLINGYAKTALKEGIRARRAGGPTVTVPVGNRKPA
jgi:hypothetical protein